LIPYVFRRGFHVAVNTLRPGWPQICWIDAIASCANSDAVLTFLLIWTEFYESFQGMLNVAVQNSY